ncbi:MAG: hypothetical protein K2Z81_27920, partial [Cyanobacteria bacterium]|nr:hypothetical protein [Cyanobacteriota bacterium]
MPGANGIQQSMMKLVESEDTTNASLTVVPELESPQAETACSASLEQTPSEMAPAAEDLADPKDPQVDGTKLARERDENKCGKLISKVPDQAAAPLTLGESTTDSCKLRRFDLKQNLKQVGNYLQKSITSTSSWLWTMRAPALLLSAILLIPKLVLGWIVVILVKPIATWLYQYCPSSWKTQLEQLIPEAIKESQFLKDLGEGADQGLPFMLFWLYLFCIPFAIIWIAVHWASSFLAERTSVFEHTSDKLVFVQNKQSDRASAENNFFYSRIFGIVVFLFFALGIPALCSYAVYEKLGIEQTINSHPASTARRCSHPPA